MKKKKYLKIRTKLKEFPYSAWRSEVNLRELVRSFLGNEGGSALSVAGFTHVAISSALIVLFLKKCGRFRLGLRRERV